MKLNIKKFGFWIDPGASQGSANDIVNKHEEIKGEIAGLNSGFINQVNTLWYTKTSNNTTISFSNDVNDKIVMPLQGNFETLLNNYVSTANNLLSESGETVSGSISGAQNTNVDWNYVAGSKNLLPDLGELGGFVSSAAVPRLEAIRDKANELVSLLQGAGDMDAASKSAMINDARIVSNNANNLSQTVQNTFTKAAEAEETSVQNIQKTNQQRNG